MTVPGDELAVFVGGLWAGTWLWRDALEANQAAARRMGHTSADPAGVALGYRPTDEFADHPAAARLKLPRRDGRVWRWQP